MNKSNIDVDDDTIPHSTTQPYYIVFLLIVLVWSTAINGCVLWALTKPRLHDPRSKYSNVVRALLSIMCGAALVQVITTISSISFNIFSTNTTSASGTSVESSSFPFGYFACFLIGHYFLMPLICSWLCEAYMAYDRYSAIVRATNHEQYGHTLHIIHPHGASALALCILGVAECITISPGVIMCKHQFCPDFAEHCYPPSFWSYGSERFICSTDHPTSSCFAYVVILVGTYMGSLSVMIFCYFLVWREAYRQKNNNEKLLMPDSVEMPPPSPPPEKQVHEEEPRPLSPASWNSLRPYWKRTTSGMIALPSEYLTVTFTNSNKALRTILIILLANVLTAAPLLIAIALEYYSYSTSVWTHRCLTYTAFLKSISTPLVYGFFERNVRDTIFKAMTAGTRALPHNNKNHCLQEMRLIITDNLPQQQRQRRLSISSNFLGFIPITAEPHQFRTQKSALSNEKK